MSKTLAIDQGEVVKSFVNTWRSSGLCRAGSMSTMFIQTYHIVSSKVERCVAIHNVHSGTFVLFSTLDDMTWLVPE
jgi:hypothetical protein